VAGVSDFLREVFYPKVGVLITSQVPRSGSYRLDSECLRALAIVLDDAGLCADEVCGVRTATYEGYPYPEAVVDVEFDAYGCHYCYLVGVDSDCILEAYVY
jgi:hypothetical protein